MRNIIKIFLLTVAPLLTACETDSYRTGDGALSAMRAEFVEAHTDADARVMAVETDGGERLTLTGLGTFSVQQKAERVGRNPRTGAAVKIPPRKVIKFRPTVEIE